MVFVQVFLDKINADVFTRFRLALTHLEQVQACHMVAAGFDYLLTLRFADIDMRSYGEFLANELTVLPGAMQTHT